MSTVSHFFVAHMDGPTTEAPHRQTIVQGVASMVNFTCANRQLTAGLVIEGIQATEHVDNCRLQVEVLTRELLRNVQVGPGTLDVNFRTISTNPTDPRNSIMALVVELNHP